MNLKQPIQNLFAYAITSTKALDPCGITLTIGWRIAGSTDEAVGWATQRFIHDHQDSRILNVIALESPWAKVVELAELSAVREGDEL